MELGKKGRTKVGELVREAKGEDRNNHRLVSANIRSVQLSVEAELSYRVAK